MADPKPSWSVDPNLPAASATEVLDPRPTGSDQSKPSWSVFVDSLIQSRATPAPAPQSIVLDDSDMGYIKIPVRVATLGDFTPTGPATIQGVTLVNGDRVLIGFGATNPVASQYGGVWLVNTSGAWTRAIDALTWDLLLPGTIVAVREGDFHGQLFVHVTDPGVWNSGSLGTTVQIWSTDVDSASVGAVPNSASLQVLDVSSIADGTSLFVRSYKARFTLDKITARSSIPHRVFQAASAAGWWVRDEGDGDPFWQAQATWYIDPAGTNSVPGNDEADGATALTPIKSIAEFRRRVRGAMFTSDVVIRCLSGSTVTDDGMFYGFTTTDLLIYVRLLGTPAPIGVSGTVANYQPYSGNNRGQFQDAAIPTSWTASNAISNQNGSRFVRKVGAGVRHYSQLIKDLGSKSVQFGVVVDWDDTDPVTIRTVETNFANGDAYEVVSMPPWPALYVDNCNVLIQCFDIQGLVAPNFRGASNSGGQIRYRLCGFPQNTSFIGGALLYSCVACMTAGGGLVGSGALQLLPFNCSFTNGSIYQFSGAVNMHGIVNIFVNSQFIALHGAQGSAVGVLRVFDCTANNFMRVGYCSTCVAVDPIVGSGNTNALIECDAGSQFYGAALISATTSLATPYAIAGVFYAAPAFDMSSGSGIFN